MRRTLNFGCNKNQGMCFHTSTIRVLTCRPSSATHFLVCKNIAFRCFFFTQHVLCRRPDPPCRFVDEREKYTQVIWIPSFLRDSQHCCVKRLYRCLCVDLRRLISAASLAILVSAFSTLCDKPGGGLRIKPGGGGLRNDKPGGERPPRGAPTLTPPGDDVKLGGGGPRGGPRARGSDDT